MKIRGIVYMNGLNDKQDAGKNGWNGQLLWIENEQGNADSGNRESVA